MDLRNLEAEFDRQWSMAIDGELLGEESNDRLPVVNPATGRQFTAVPAATSDDVDDAVAAAREAFESFRWRAPEERADLLERVADRIEDNVDELARLGTLENGKPLEQSRTDAGKAAERARYYASAIEKFYGASIKHSPEEVGLKVHEPYGVVGIIIPWNWPLTHSFDFAAIALSLGNAVVLKPAPETPLSSLRIAELVDDVLPDGLFNVVPGGDEPGSALTSHPDVDQITFVGNDRTGEKVLKAAAEHITPTMVELGGKNAAIVFPDADLERAADGVVAGSFKNSGESCTTSERLLVHSDVYDEFVDAVRARVADVEVGSGFADGVDVGPLISQAHLDRVRDRVSTAERQGAKLLAEADGTDEAALDGGFWFPPRVYEISTEMDIAREEVFGPVLGVLPFDDEDEAIEIANGTEYGLAAYVWTNGLDRARRLSAKLEVGKVSVNHPSGGKFPQPHGGYKRSGFGRKNDYEEAMRQFSQVKSIYMDLGTDDVSL